MLTKDNVQYVYGLTPLQEGMLIDFARNPESVAYIEQFDFVMSGPLDLPAVRTSFAALVARHDVLRTIFSFRKTDQPRQVVLRQREAPVEWLDLIGMEASAARAELERAKEAQLEKGFNISADLLVRMMVVSLAEHRHRLVLTFHHIILDGWSLAPLFEDFFGLYEHCLSGVDLPPTPAAPYRDYLHWIGRQEPAQARDYWSGYLDGYQNDVGVPYFDQHGDGLMASGEHNVQLGVALTARLEDCARTLQLTVGNLLQAAWGILLQKFNYCDDVVFGSVVSGRPGELDGIERMVGLFINTVPLRVQAQPEDSFVTVAGRVQAQGFAASAFEHYPLAAIQAATPLKNRLINHLLVFENLPLSRQLQQLSTLSRDLRVDDVVVHQVPKYDFQAIVTPGADLKLSFVYNSRRFGADTMAVFGRSLVCLLSAIVQQPDCPVGRLPVCAEADRLRVLTVLNATSRAYPRDSSLVDLFEACALEFAARPAVTVGERSLSYAQLRQAALTLGGQLREAGVQAGDTVGVLTPRSIEMVVSRLAVLYLGAAYLPLETQIAEERLRFMLADAAVRLVCVHPDHRTQVPTDVAGIVLDGAPAEPLTHPVPVAADAVAYIMYTSGSTGQPKGCLVSHRNIVRLVKNTNYIAYGPDTRFLQTASPAFDPSTFEIWGPLLNGGQLFPVQEATLLDADLLRQEIRRQDINTLQLVTALFSALFESDDQLFAGLRYLVVGGEAMPPRIAARVRRASPGLTLVNAYGPTENTAISTFQRISRDYAERIPIGRPIANSTAYIMDAAGAILPPGAYGELCLGGDGVALGYRNRPELTREKFIADPFQPGGRLYRSGDLARWLPDGSLDMLGRNDTQVKIRGFRVELGEIERALAQHPLVAEAAVVAHDGVGGKQLHAFYVAVAEIAPAQLSASLSALPSYMVPTFFRRLERMPLSVNGKLDRRALPVAQNLVQRVTATPMVEPSGATARRIAEICRDVLGIAGIGLHDNFFEAGATSLNLLAINNRLKDAFSREIPVAVLFEYTTIARLAEYLDDDKAAEAARQAREHQDLAEARQALLRTRNLMKNFDDV